ATFQIRSAKPCRALECPILVQHDSGSDDRCPRQVIGELRGLGTIFGEIHHEATRLHAEMRTVCQVALKYVQELRIALRTPHGERVAYNPEEKPHEPDLKADSECRRKGSIHDRHRARGAREQDWLR